MIPLLNRTHYSIQQSVSKSYQLGERCEKLGYKGCVMMDNGTVSGAVDFMSEIKGKGVKPILGSAFYMKQYDGQLPIVSRNLDGWKRLMKLTSIANRNFDKVAKLPVETIEKESGLVCFVGGIDHFIVNLLFTSREYILSDNPSSLLKPDHESILEDNIRGLTESFDEVFILIETPAKSPAHTLIALLLRNAAVKTKRICMAASDSRYASDFGKDDYLVILASHYKKRIKELHKDSATNLDYGRFVTQAFDFPTNDSLLVSGNTAEEIENTNALLDLCEDYSIFRKPSLPRFAPADVDEFELFKQKCREGWVKRLRPDWDKQVYGERIKKELEVFQRANLEGYFLITQDIMDYAHINGWMTGPGRGSVGGSLIAYLLNITEIDSIKYDLIFERFYNEGRNTEGNFSYPDIDSDFPATKREYIINYIRNKYGEDRVGQIATFGRLQGRSALKETLRAHNACDDQTANQITKFIPNEAEIADDMEENQIDSILEFVLQNDPKAVSDYCIMKDDGTLDGEYAEYFKQAIRIEGTFKSTGKHASGMVISKDPLNEVCPMIDQQGDIICGMDMRDIEKLGLVKFDLLGLSCLDKLMAVNSMLRYGRIIE